MLFFVAAPYGQVGGNAGQCNGALSIDWSSCVAGNPGALGNPFSAGAVINVQAWFRDPPAPGTTNLSDGLEFDDQPSSRTEH